MRLFALVVMVVFLASCAPTVDLPPSDPVVRPGDGVEPARPDIPRVYLPGTIDVEVEDPVTPTPTTPPVFINESRGAPRVELDVLLGDVIGEDHSLITVAEFPLLRHPPVRLGSASLLGYDEELRFDFGVNSTGKIIFGKNDDDAIGTFLFFAEDKPILEYRVRLLRGTFTDLEGKQIQLLGHTYVVAEATNRSVQLFGIDVASNLAFSNGSKLVVNSSSQSGTLVRVYPNELRYTLYADDTDEDGILLGVGERLSDRIPHNRLASRILDIMYVGMPEQTTGPIAIERSRDGYRLRVDTVRGTMVIPLLTEDAGEVIFGDLDERLHVTPCPSILRYCIAPGDHVLLTSPRGQSYVVEYSSASNASKDLIIRDGQNRYVYTFVGEPGRNAYANIMIDDWSFRAMIGPENNETGDHNISIEQGFVQGRAELVTVTGAIIRIGDVNGTRLPLEIRIPAAITHDRREERIALNITLSNGDGRIFVGGNITFVEDDDDDLIGMSQYGVGVLLDTDGDTLPARTGREAVFLTPSENAYGVVALEG